MGRELVDDDDSSICSLQLHSGVAVVLLQLADDAGVVVRQQGDGMCIGTAAVVGDVGYIEV